MASATGNLLAYLTHRWAAARESKGEALSLDMVKAFERGGMGRSLQNFHPTCFPRIYASGSPAFALGATSRSVSTVFARNTFR